MICIQRSGRSSRRGILRRDLYRWPGGGLQGSGGGIGYFPFTEARQLVSKSLIDFRNWYEPIGSGPGEKEVCFDSLEELGKYLRENPGLAEKVGYEVGECSH